MSHRKRRSREKAVNYAVACISDDELEMQPGLPTLAGPSKGKQRAKKIRITEYHSLTPVGRQSAAPPPPKGPAVPIFQPIMSEARVHSAYNMLSAAVKHLGTISPDGTLRLF
jgi:hypothetical protein